MCVAWKSISKLEDCSSAVKKKQFYVDESRRSHWLVVLCDLTLDWLLETDGEREQDICLLFVHLRDRSNLSPVVFAVVFVLLDVIW
ncbi:hypothetical protein TNCV_3547661 [Trichonephila clavipes]|nr:hypothetical protein TNCV_3547661 [Trichonephila clavipes]